MDAVTVHLPQAVAAGGRMLPPGNYTITTPKGIGELPVLRFQGEEGSIATVLATREYIDVEEMAPGSGLIVKADAESKLRIVSVYMEGNPFRFLLSLSDFTN